MSEIVWIAGASTGIGAALAGELARRGNTVAVSARSADKLQALASRSYGSGRIVTYPLDVTDASQVKATVDRIVVELGRIDTAVLCAGTYEPDKPGQFDAALIRRQFDLNVLGTVTAIDAVLPGMRKRGDGHIAIVSSVAGYRGLPMAAGYGATKAALTNFAEALRPDFALQGIRLQVICPGFVKTPLTDKNDFPMPFIISAEKAARIIADGLRSRRFEIVFPWQMAILMKLLRILPYGLYFFLTGQMAKASRKQTGH